MGATVIIVFSWLNYQASCSFALYCRAEVGGSVDMYRDRVRMKIDKDYFSEAAHLPWRDNDSLAITEV